MKTKLSLTIADTEHFLDSTCLSNWEQVKCVFKREDFSGVTRSVTSAFDFTRDAYDRLLALYLAEGVTAECKVSMYVIDNNWRWSKEHECMLDFTSVKVSGGVFSVNAIDNSVAAALKANRSTKYEMAVGSDITPDGTLYFDRVPMQEQATYELTQGDSEEGSSAISVRYDAAEDHGRAWAGLVGKEISVNGTIYFADDQETTADGYAIKAEKDADVTLTSRLVTDRLKSTEGVAELYVRQRRGISGDVVASVHVGRMGGGIPAAKYKGHFASYAELTAAYPVSGSTSANDGEWTDVGDDMQVYVRRVIGSHCEWRAEGVSKDAYAVLATTIASHVFHMMVGDVLILEYGNGSQSCTTRVLESSFAFSWQARGEAFDVDVVTPNTLASALMGKVFAGKYNVVPDISAYDPRLTRTRILGGESIRGFEVAKIHASFGDFADWMNVVFGYTYTIDAPTPSRLTASTMGFDEIIGTPYPTQAHASSVGEICYNTALGRFVCTSATSGEYGYYDTWAGSEEYNADGAPRTDRLFRLADRLYYFEGAAPIEYFGDEVDAGKDFCHIHFLHRSELFADEADVDVISNAKDITYSVDASLVYSDIEIGYDKQNYDNVNGRDEWNMSISYTTGCSVSERKLQMLSKFRADCYGMEFAAQKRTQKTTDNSADQATFFLLVDADGKIDRSTPIEGALTDGVFGGAFSPLACIKANEAYLGVQADSLTLRYASATGNSDIAIDGERLNADVTLTQRLYRAEGLQFTSDDIDGMASVNDIVEVSGNGITYRGYISEIELYYGRPQAATYKLIVKSVTS